MNYTFLNSSFAFISSCSVGVSLQDTPSNLYVSEKISFVAFTGIECWYFVQNCFLSKFYGWLRVGLWRKLSTEELMLLNCGDGEDSREFLGLQGDPTSPFWRRSALGVHWKDWCWSWNSNTLATSCKELTHWKGPWCWEGLGTGEEGDNRGWDGWMASPTRWTWVWVNSGSWWWTGRPGLLQFMES